MKKFLAGTFGLILLVVACTGTTASDVVGKAQLVIGTSTVSTTCPAGPCGLTGAYLMLKTLYPGIVSPNADLQVLQLLDSATQTGGLLDQLKVAASTADQTTTLRGIVSVGTQILGIVAGEMGKIPNVDPKLTAYFQAAAILIPILANTASSISGQQVAGAKLRVFQNPSMTEDQARAILRSPR